MAIVVVAASLLVTLSMAMATEVYWTPGQELAPPVLYGSYAWGDLDADGDTDLFRERTACWNDGSCPGLPMWRTESNVLPDMPGCSNRHATLGDLDADGDLDLITGCKYEYNLLLTWNVGTPPVPQWDGTSSWIVPNSCLNDAPRLADLDADGDLDILWLCDGIAVFSENTGTSQVPVWVGFGEPIHSISMGYPSSCALGDLDLDGDLDLVGIGPYGGVRCWENTGTPQEWQFVENAQMLSGVETAMDGPGVALPDVDCDGDLDLLLMVTGGLVFLYLNEAASFVAPASWGTIKALYR